MPILVVGADLGGNNASLYRRHNGRGAGSGSSSQAPGSASLLRPSSSEDLLATQQQRQMMMNRPDGDGEWGVEQELQERRKARGEDTSHGFLLSHKEMDSVINLRAYRVASQESERVVHAPGERRIASRSAPNTARRLIGEDFYPKKEEVVTVKKNRTKDAFSQGAAGNGKINAQYRKVMKLKNDSKQKTAHESLQSKIRSSETRMSNVKYGIPLLHQCEEFSELRNCDEKQETESHPTADTVADGSGSLGTMMMSPRSPRQRTEQDLLRRAVSHVAEYSQNASDKLFSMEAEIRAYIDALKRDLVRDQGRVNEGGGGGGEEGCPVPVVRAKAKLPPFVEFYQRLLDGNGKDMKARAQAADMGALGSPPKEGKGQRGHKNGASDKKLLSLMDRLNKIETVMPPAAVQSRPETSPINVQQQQRRSSVAAISADSSKSPKAINKNYSDVPYEVGGDVSVGSLSTATPVPPGKPKRTSYAKRNQRNVVENSDEHSALDAQSSRVEEINPSSNQEVDPLDPNSVLMQQLMSSRRFRVATERAQSPKRTNVGWKVRQKNKALQLRERRLFAATRYDNDAVEAQAPSRKMQIGTDEAHDAARLAETQIAPLRNCIDAEIKTMASLSKRADAVFDEVADTSAHLLSAWETSSARVARQEGLFINDITSKEEDWGRNIGVKFEALVIDDGKENIKSGRAAAAAAVGSAGLTKDLHAMRKRVQEAQFQRELYNLLQFKWFVALVIRLQRRASAFFASVPTSCIMYLLAVKHLFGLGENLTAPLFYQLVEKFVDPIDQRDVVVHRTLQTFREVLNISCESYLDYLESKEIQPCPELTSRVREIRKEARIAAAASSPETQRQRHAIRTKVVADSGHIGGGRGGGGGTSVVAPPPAGLTRRARLESMEAFDEEDDEDDVDI